MEKVLESITFGAVVGVNPAEVDPGKFDIKSRDPVSHVARDFHFKGSHHPRVWGRDGFRGDKSIADM